MMVKIKGTELRIGNLVWIDVGMPSLQVHEIMSKDITAIYHNENNVADKVFPVPLNEDWLLRMGFEKTSHTTYKKDDIHINEQGHCFLIADDPYCSHQTAQNITRVHQLQNLYFALTGKELTFKRDGI